MRAKSASLPGAITPFPRVEAEDLRGIGGGDLGEALEGHPALAHTLP
jgi:hypothetical protein